MDVRTFHGERYLKKKQTSIFLIIWIKNELKSLSSQSHLAAKFFLYLGLLAVFTDIFPPLPSPGGFGEHVALQHQRRILPVDEAEKCRRGRGAVQTGAATTRSPHPEPSVR